MSITCNLYMAPILMKPANYEKLMKNEQVFPVSSLQIQKLICILEKYFCNSFTIISFKIITVTVHLNTAY